MKILLVEDDELSGLVLSEALTAQHYTVNLATDGQTGLALAEACDYDLILMDVLIPKLDGISLCRKLRSQGYQKPILLLTGNTSNQDRVTGLDAGADDYVSKPYELGELLARIRALLRRGREPIAPELSWGNLHLNPIAGEVTYRDNPLSLTRKEYSLLELFLRNPQRVFSRSDILDRLWSLTDAPAESAVTTHIKDLRHKLKAAGVETEVIETVYGFGYRLKALQEKKDKAPRPDKSSSDLASAIAPTTSNASELSSVDPGTPPTPKSASTHKLFEQFKGTFANQITVIEQAATTLLQTHSLDSELQLRARQEAHKLAGSLGMFAHLESSTLAREAEHILLTNTALGEAEAVRLLQIVSTIQHQLAQSSALIPQKANLNLGNEKYQDSDRLFEEPPPSQSTGSKVAKVLVVDNDVALTKQLQTEAIAWGMQIIISDIALAKSAIARTTPNAILLNLDLSNASAPSNNGLTLLTELSVQQPNIPVLVITERNDLGDRVKITRLGGQGFFRKPVTVQQILHAIDQLLPQDFKEAKVMIVDDDPAALSVFCNLLQPWGIQVTALEEPQRFWDVLTTIVPDLLVLDLEMPNFSGIDLCKVVRHDALWGDLPILVVTAHTNVEAVQEVFTAGADDFISKPVVGPEFVSRILSRLERVRLQRRLQAAQK